MRSPEEPPDTRERILTAAIARFGTHGFRSSLRSIAADADVSAALIIKHFSSKEGLREACDERVLDIVGVSKSAVMQSKDLRGTILSHMASFDELQPILHYFVRTLFEGGAMTRHMLTEMHTHALDWMKEGIEAGHIKPSQNEDLRVKLVIGMSIGRIFQSLVLSNKDLSDVDTKFWVDMEEGLLQASLELYTEGLLTRSTMLDEYMLYRGDPPAEG